MRTRAGIFMVSNAFFLCDMHSRSVVRNNLKMRQACKPGFAEQTQSLKDKSMPGTWIET